MLSVSLLLVNAFTASYKRILRLNAAAIAIRARNVRAANIAAYISSLVAYKSPYI